jgi:hypothetical protein
MMRRTAVALAVASALALGAEAGTKFKSTWKPPDAVPVNFQGQKVAAIVMLPEAANRRGIEDELAYALTGRGLVGIPAHRLVPPEEMKDKDRVRASLEKAGVVGAVVMRAIDRQAGVSEDSASYWVSNYWTFSGYYSWGWGGIYSPGTVRMETMFTVETLVFDVKADKLLWAGTTETKNPKRVDDFMKDLVSTAAKEVKKQGLVAKR